jgi:uncharacterized protein (DUF1499 family)
MLEDTDKYLKVLATTEVIVWVVPSTDKILEVTDNYLTVLATTQIIILVVPSY